MAQARLPADLSSLAFSTRHRRRSMISSSPSRTSAPISLQPENRFVFGPMADAGRLAAADAPTEQFSGISPAHLRDLMFNFLSKTRWARTFHLIHPYELER